MLRAIGDKESHAGAAQVLLGEGAMQVRFTDRQVEQLARFGGAPDLRPRSVEKSRKVGVTVVAFIDVRQSSSSAGEPNTASAIWSAISSMPNSSVLSARLSASEGL